MTRFYTIEEEVWNTLTHSFGALICAFIFGILVSVTFNETNILTLKDISCCVFGLSSMFMFVASSLYHAITNIQLKRQLKLFDHIAIYFLIAGTYIPLALTSIISTNPILGWIFVGVQALAVIGGICYKLFSSKNYSMISVLIYCLLGWSAVFILGPLINNLSTQALFWLIAGGIAYTAGVPFYILKQYKWTHTIWHIFVVCGVICHYVMMFML